VHARRFRSCEGRRKKRGKKSKEIGRGGTHNRGVHAPKFSRTFCPEDERSNDLEYPERKTRIGRVARMGETSGRVSYTQRELDAPALRPRAARRGGKRGRKAAAQNLRSKGLLLKERLRVMGKGWLGWLKKKLKEHQSTRFADRDWGPAAKRGGGGGGFPVDLTPPFRLSNCEEGNTGAERYFRKTSISLLLPLD